MVLIALTWIRVPLVCDDRVAPIVTDVVSFFSLSIDIKIESVVSHLIGSIFGVLGYKEIRF